MDSALARRRSASWQWGWARELLFFGGDMVTLPVRRGIHHRCGGSAREPMVKITSASHINLHVLRCGLNLMPPLNFSTPLEHRLDEPAVSLLVDLSRITVTLEVLDQMLESDERLPMEVDFEAYRRTMVGPLSPYRCASPSVNDAISRYERIESVIRGYRPPE